MEEDRLWTDRPHRQLGFVNGRKSVQHIDGNGAGDLERESLFARENRTQSMAREILGEDVDAAWTFGRQATRNDFRQMRVLDLAEQSTLARQKRCRRCTGARHGTRRSQEIRRAT